MAAETTTSDERARVEAFLYHEARLMDAHAYADWLALFADDAVYWVPSNRDDGDPRREVSIVYADRGQLEFRIQQLASGAAWSQDPRSRLCRSVSNVEVERDGKGELEVRSVFNLTELRRHRQRLFAGRALYRLRVENGGFRIAWKKVELVNNDEVIDNLTFLV